MDGILPWLAAGAAGLLFVAFIVAWWEHLGRRGSLAPQPAVSARPAQQAQNVDVDLDNLPESDAAQRREVLDSAMERMTQPGALHEARGQRWIETAPMVGPGPPLVRGSSTRTS